MSRIVLSAALAAALLASGCAVVTVGAAAVGVAADAAVGTVKLTGKAVGAAAGLVIPDRKD